jgi:tetratricopeptide (TPR) repeat protein
MFSGVLAFWLWTGIPAPVIPGSSAGLPQTLSRQTSEDTQEARFTQAVTRLKQGKRFENAIAALEKLVQEAPDNRSYALTLGCAYLCRAASIAHAASQWDAFQQDKAKYQQWLQEWQAAQKERSHPKHGAPKPQPPVLRTVDDGKAFILTKAEAAQSFLACTAKAKAALDRASALSTDAPMQGEMEYVRGWAILMERRFGWQVVKEPELPVWKDALEAFQKATQLMPRQARYWESLGYVYLGDDSWFRRQEADPDQAIPAFRRAIKLEPHNISLLCHLYYLQKDSNPEQAMNHLQQAAQYDPENAYLHYQLARLYFRKTPYRTLLEEEIAALRARRQFDNEEVYSRLISRQGSAQEEQEALTAVQCLERGNQARRLEYIHFVRPIPELLRAAWEFQPVWATHFLKVPEWFDISYPALCLAKIATRKNQFEIAMRSSQATIAMGRRIIGDFFDRTLPISLSEENFYSHGAIVALTGYEQLQETYQAMGDARNAERIALERRMFRKAYQKRIEANKAAQEATYAIR